MRIEIGQIEIGARVFARLIAKYQTNLAFFKEKMRDFEEGVCDLMDGLLQLKLSEEPLFQLLCIVSLDCQKIHDSPFIHKLFMSKNTQSIQKFMDLMGPNLLSRFEKTRDKQRRTPKMILFCFQGGSLCQHYMNLMSQVDLQLVFSDASRISEKAYLFMKQDEATILHYFSLPGSSTQNVVLWQGEEPEDLNERCPEMLLYIHKELAPKYYMERRGREALLESLGRQDKQSCTTSDLIEFCQPSANRAFFWEICGLKCMREAVEWLFKSRRKKVGNILLELKEAKNEEYRFTAAMILCKMLRSYYAIGLSMPCDLAYFQKEVLLRVNGNYLSNAIVIGLSFQGGVKVTRDTPGFENAITNLGELKHYLNTLTAQEKHHLSFPLSERLKIFLSLLSAEKHRYQCSRMQGILDLIGRHACMPSLQQLCLFAVKKSLAVSAAKEPSMLLSNR